MRRIILGVCSAGGWMPRSLVLRNLRNVLRVAGRVGRSRSWLDLADVGLAGVLLVAGEAEVIAGEAASAKWVLALLTVAVTAPVAIRRRAPLLALAVALVAVLVHGAIEDELSQVTLPVALVILVFTVGNELSGAKAWIGLVLPIAALGIGMVVTGTPWPEFVFLALLYGAPWAYGRGLRLRSARVADLAEVTDRLMQEREQRERAAATAERARIARELHDIVSHSISVVVIQAQAIRRRLGPEHVQERDDLANVEATARQAMTEMRRLFGILRAGGDQPPLAPPPGLDQLDRTIGDMRRSGAPIDYRIDGEPTPLSPGVDLAAYRIVQEALTNVRKHAPGAAASVALRYDTDVLEITVDDDGIEPRSRGTPGYGLVGMRERVTLFGGSLEAGPRAGGGFRVRATLPIRGEAPS